MTLLFQFLSGTAVVVIAISSANADTVASCGSNHHVGDFLTKNGERILCSSEGLWAIVPHVLAFLRGLLLWIDRIGTTQAIIGAIVAVAVGVRLTGTRATLTQTVQNGIIIKEAFRPETQGTARTGLSHFLGNLLKAGGIIVFLMALFSCATGI